MAGTRKGGQQAAKTNRRLYGRNFYKKIGSMGGKATYYGQKGFAANRELASIAGTKGGKISKRRKANG